MSSCPQCDNKELWFDDYYLFHGCNECRWMGRLEDFDYEQFDTKYYSSTTFDIVINLICLLILAGVFSLMVWSVRHFLG